MQSDGPRDSMRLNDRHAKAIERTSLFRFVGLNATWVAIPDAQQFAWSGYVEVDHIRSSRDDASFCIEDLYGENGHVFRVRSDVCAICMQSDPGRSACGLAL